MKNKNLSKERRVYLQKIKKQKILVIVTQLLILIGFLVIWETLANLNIIDSFITSKPTRILNTFMNLSANNLSTHILVTVYETVVGFMLGTLLGVLVAILLWWSNFLAKVSEPFLVVLNSLPKVALRTNYYNMGRRWNTCYYSYGNCNFLNCNNFRNIKWIYENR
jgi:NitT/TauT family transport system permease protein